MSGIYIQGAEMPKSCWVCELGGAEQMDNHTCPFYSMEYWEQENYQDKIADGCPLIPVPDHGGLVEKQKVVQKVYDYCHTADDKYCGPDDVGELWEEMQAMPTIIPADKEGDG